MWRQSTIDHSKPLFRLPWNSLPTFHWHLWHSSLWVESAQVTAALCGLPNSTCFLGVCESLLGGHAPQPPTNVQAAAEVNGPGTHRSWSGLCYELQPENYSDLIPDSYEVAFSLDLTCFYNFQDSLWWWIKWQFSPSNWYNAPLKPTLPIPNWQSWRRLGDGPILFWCFQVQGWPVAELRLCCEDRCLRKILQ